MAEDPIATVLLVEDNEDNQFVYRTILEHFNYRVIVAGDGGEGVRQAREALPDVILMDVSIPVIDGLEATRIIKADPATAGIPVIALTAHALSEDRRRAQEAGCDSYLSKPAEPKRVLAEVQRMLAERRSSG